MRELIRRIINWALYEKRGELVETSLSSRYGNSIKASSGVDLEEGGRPLNFRVYNAFGGKVVQMHYYDPKTDRTTTNMYIITDQDDMAEELSQIITRECLSR